MILSAIKVLVLYVPSEIDMFGEPAVVTVFVGRVTAAGPPPPVTVTEILTVPVAEVCDLGLYPSVSAIPRTELRSCAV